MHRETSSSRKVPYGKRSSRVAALALAVIGAAAAADSLQAILARLDQSAATFKGLTADMRRLHHTAVIDENEIQTGSLIVRRSKPKDLQVLFDIKSPDVQQWAYTGRTFEKYNPKTNIVEIYDVDKKYSSTVNKYMLLGFGSSSAELKQAYDLAFGGPDTVNGGKTTRIVLTPKEPDTALHLVKAELWISDETGIALRQKMYYAGGDYDLVDYSNMKVNPGIPESAVKMNLPRNVKKEHPLK